MKKFFSAITMAVILLFILWACGVNSAASANQQLRLGTASTTGAFYPIGGMMGAVLNEEIDGYNFTAEATGGSTENVRLIDMGEMAIGFSIAHITYFAYNGTEFFEAEGKKNILGLFNIYTTPIQFVTLKSANINSMADFAGKTISVGAPGTSTNITSNMLLGLFGLVNGQNVRFVALSPGESMDGLTTGAVDIAMIAVGHPTAVIQELSMTHDISILNLTPE